MTKQIVRILATSELSGINRNDETEFTLSFELYHNPSFSAPCLSQTISFTTLGPEGLTESDREIGETWGYLVRQIFAADLDFETILGNFDNFLHEIAKTVWPQASFFTSFDVVGFNEYSNEPVAVDEEKIWASETETRPDTEYLFNLFDQWLELSEKSSDHDLLLRQFNDFGFFMGGKLMKRLPMTSHVNFFISPLNDLFNVDELVVASENNTGTMWSTNRYCSYGDVILFYFTKSGGKILAGQKFEGDNQEFFERLPGSIFAAGRLLTDSMRQHKKGLFYWNSKAFIGDILIFDRPIATDDIIAADGISLTRHFRDSRGGLRQPKSLYGHDEYLSVFKELLFKDNPSLADSYLNLESFWPESIPSPDSQNWAEEMGKADVRIFKDKDINRNLNQKHLSNFFQDEEGVRKMFIDPLLQKVVPPDARILQEFETHKGKSIKVDYCIEKGALKLPVEAKFDIYTDHSFSWERVFEYLDVSHNGKGLLIDINGVFELDQKQKSKQIIFERIGMNEESVKKLQKWLQNFFKTK